ncbi:hypothetical protein IPG41_00840 [Candidatus Peregrinibacteria bacterium]|nr:MAG: hypothetical protein IPG41_00840 [Candidatus Peregrinibacteria bacterium]
MNEEKKKHPYLIIPQYRTLLYFGFGTALAWGAWLLVLYKLDPFLSPSLSLSLFFITTFIALSGTFSIVLTLLKKWKNKDQIYFKHIMISLRQGVLLSICTVLCLGLLMLGFLRIWNGLLLVALIMLIEFYFSGKDEL